MCPLFLFYEELAIKFQFLLSSFTCGAVMQTAHVSKPRKFWNNLFHTHIYSLRLIEPMIFSQFCFNSQEFSNLCEIIIGVAYFEACISSVACLSLHPGSWSCVG